MFVLKFVDLILINWYKWRYIWYHTYARGRSWLGWGHFFGIQGVMRKNLIGGGLKRGGYKMLKNGQKSINQPSFPPPLVHMYVSMIFCLTYSMFPIQGDSGGPLICNGYLAGVVSKQCGCGDKNYYITLMCLFMSIGSKPLQVRICLSFYMLSVYFRHFSKLFWLIKKYVLGEPEISSNLPYMKSSSISKGSNLH